MSSADYPTAIFDLFVDDELKDTVEADSRGEAGRLLKDRNPDHTGLHMQGRVQIKVREHEHEPAAGNMSKCVFCQVDIDRTADGRYIERSN